MNNKEELTELPKYWCIRGCKELREFIQQYEETKKVRIPVYRDFPNYCYYLKDVKDMSSWSGTKETSYNGYTEISFEEFKRLVLKESKFKVGDRVEPIKYPVYTTCSYRCNDLGPNREIVEIDINLQRLRLNGDTDLWFYMKNFKLKEETMDTNSTKEETKVIKISETLLFTYYNASQPHQKEYLTKHFQLDGSTTVGSIKGLYDIACPDWQPKIKANHPNCFKEDKVWKRIQYNTKKKDFYYISDKSEGHFEVCHSGYDKTNLNFTFSTKEEADNNALLYNTMMLMRSWAKFYNEVDGFKADWGVDNYKYGICIVRNKLEIDFKHNSNYFLFHISISTRERANELLAEFKDDLERLIQLGMFN